MTSNGKTKITKLYLVESYNFYISLPLFEFMQKSYNFLNINWKLRPRYENWDLDSISIIWLWRWLQMENFELKSCRSHRKLQFSYKVLRPSEFKQKNKIIWKQTRPLASWPTAVAGVTVPLAPLTPLGTTEGPCRRPHGARCIILQKLFRTIYFYKIEGEKIY
jgi:hypothetical protein